MRVAEVGSVMAVVAAIAGGCASVQRAQASDVAAQGAVYSCVVSTLRSGPLPVVKADSSQGVVTAQLRSDASPGSPRISGGQTGSPIATGDYESPYTIDVVTAHVRYDATKNKPVVDVSASSGNGSSAKGGYVQGPPSDVAQKSARAVQACAA